MEKLKKSPPPPIPHDAPKASEKKWLIGGDKPHQETKWLIGGTKPHAPVESPWAHEVPAPKPPNTTAKEWMGKPILHSSHHDQLEQDSAIHQFANGMPQDQAEARAYQDYERKHRIASAAHHLSGIKTAKAAGDLESAKKHSAMYSLHMKAMGHDPLGEPHPDVLAHMTHSPARTYKFKSAPGDVFALNENIAKNENDDSPTHFHVTYHSPNGTHLGTSVYGSKNRMRTGHDKMDNKYGGITSKKIKGFNPAKKKFYSKRPDGLTSDDNMTKEELTKSILKVLKKVEKEHLEKVQHKGDAEKMPEAVALGKLGGKKGGPARARKLPKKRRVEIARKGAKKRWEEGKREG